jgi:hypothetical protein
MFELSDIHVVDRYQHLDWQTAKVVSSTDTHGLIVSKDRLQPQQARIFLVGCSPKRSTPHIKAHNAFDPQELIQVIRATVQIKKLIETRQ